MPVFTKINHVPHEQLFQALRGLKLIFK